MMWLLDRFLLLTNIASQLRDRTPVVASLTLLGLVCFQVENWRTFVYGNPVSCDLSSFEAHSPVHKWRVEDINSLCWDQAGPRSPRGSAVLILEGAQVPEKLLESEGHGMEGDSPYIWMPYQFAVLAVCLFLPRILFLPDHSAYQFGVDAEIKALAKRLQSAEELTRRERCSLLEDIAADFLSNRCQRTGSSLTYEYLFSAVGFWLMSLVASWIHAPPDPVYFRLTLSGRTSWSRFHPLQDIFPRQANCTIAIAHASEKVADVVIPCDLTLNRFNEVGLSMLYVWCVVSEIISAAVGYNHGVMAFVDYSTPDCRNKALKSLPLPGTNRSDYIFCSAYIAVACDYQDFDSLLQLLKRVDPFVARGFVIAVGVGISPHYQQPCDVHASLNIKPDDHGKFRRLHSSSVNIWTSVIFVSRLIFNLCSFGIMLPCLGSWIDDTILEWGFRWFLLAHFTTPLVSRACVRVWSGEFLSIKDILFISFGLLVVDFVPYSWYLLMLDVALRIVYGRILTFADNHEITAFITRHRSLVTMLGEGERNAT